jgi:hypothetical protein
MMPMMLPSVSLNQAPRPAGVSAIPPTVLSPGMVVLLEGHAAAPELTNGGIHIFDLDPHLSVPSPVGIRRGIQSEARLADHKGRAAGAGLGGGRPNRLRVERFCALATTSERKTGVTHAEVVTTRLLQNERGWLRLAS